MLLSKLMGAFIMKSLKRVFIITMSISLFSVMFSEIYYNSVYKISLDSSSGKYETIDLYEYKNAKSVPLLLQYDKRWKNKSYAGDIMKNSGCGPTCLSMVCIYLLGNTKITPPYIADFAENNGYSVKDSGSKWTLISEGGNALGIKVKEIPLEKTVIIDNLKNNNPIICIMGPGDFTTTGHFIVMTEYTENNKIIINDPNSITNSKKLWSYEDIYSQIRNLWVCTL